MHTEQLGKQLYSKIIKHRFTAVTVVYLYYLVQILIKTLFQDTSTFDYTIPSCILNAFGGFVSNNITSIGIQYFFHHTAFVYEKYYFNFNNFQVIKIPYIFLIE